MRRLLATVSFSCLTVTAAVAGPPADATAVITGTSQGQLLLSYGTTTDGGTVTATEANTASQLDLLLGLFLLPNLAVGPRAGFTLDSERTGAGISQSALGFLLGVFSVAYWDVGGTVSPFSRVDASLRVVRTTASTPAATQQQTTTGLIGTVDVGAAVFLAETLALELALRGTLQTRVFSGNSAQRLDLGGGLVIGFSAFL